MSDTPNNSKIIYNTPPESSIPDDLIFTCQEAAQEEMMRWTKLDKADGSIAVVRNRLSTKDMGCGILDHETVYAMHFIDAEHARNFIQWIGVRAAIEEYERLKKPKLVLVTE